MEKIDELILRLLQQNIRLAMSIRLKLDYQNDFTNTELNKANDLILEVDKYFKQLRGGND